MASSSSSCDLKQRYQYDVFLSFSGEDTRKTFVDHLFEALQRQGIRTFKDDERLQKGKEIKEELLKSIDESRVCVVVFSKKYASSSWCLDELVKIMECQKTTGLTALPVFYDVEPTEVRHQSGLVGEAFAKHTKKVIAPKKLTRTVAKALAKHTSKKLGKWRNALKDAANLSGWELKNTAHGHEAKVIKLIVERISLELQSSNTCIDENLIGMEHRMQALNPYLEIGSDDVRMIGLKGMGGAGKTTLANTIFDKLCINFEGKSFVENVRESSKALLLKKLQEQVLRDVLKDSSINVSSVHEGTNLMKTRLCGIKVLIVLDDVDHKDQLESLAGDPSWFKSGSRIIITTRDEQVLIPHGVTRIHDVNLLSDEEAIRLFCRHAFRKDTPTDGYESQSQEVVRYAGGLPLTIKVLGSFLNGKEKHEWTDALARLKRIPLMDTLKKLELSYESLENDYKEIFLYLACFLRHWPKDDAIIMLESLGFHAINGLRVLEQKSLLKIVKEWDYCERISMHDHLVEMGQYIVRREHPDEPNKHSILWVQKEIESVLSNGLGTEATRCIVLDITPEIVLEGLENMKKLRCLIVNHGMDSRFDDFIMLEEASQYFPNSLRYLYYRNYPHQCLPRTFVADNLVTLDMCHSKIEQLWEGGKVKKKLKFVFLDDTNLKSLDLGLMPNLERLSLKGCRDLIEVHGGCLKSLVYLNLRDCTSLKSFLFIKKFESFEVLHMQGLNLRELPDCGDSNKTLLELHLSENEEIEEVPSSIGNLHKLVCLDLEDCSNLKSLPESICRLQHLRTLNLGDTCIEELPEAFGNLESLEELNLGHTKVKHLPDGICRLKRLKKLDLEYCELLEKLPDNIGQLESLELLDLSSCYNLREIPRSICMLKQLKVLYLNLCVRLEKLPDNIGQLESLELLDLSWCYRIREIPSSICMLKQLKVLNLNVCFRLEKLPDDIGKLEFLEELYLSSCYNIRELPSSICMLKLLKKLSLESCRGLEKLRDEVEDLECLQVLNIGDTRISQLPIILSLLKDLEIYGFKSKDECNHPRTISSTLDNLCDVEDILDREEFEDEDEDEEGCATF